MACTLSLTQPVEELEVALKANDVAVTRAKLIHEMAEMAREEAELQAKLGSAPAEGHLLAERFDGNGRFTSRDFEKISRASANQRAGRAGRTAPGHCLRLWTESGHLERAAQELPEVKRLDLAEVVLTLKASGIEDVAGFSWLEMPDPKALENAEQRLIDLGGIARP